MGRLHDVGPGASRRSSARRRPGSCSSCSGTCSRGVEPVETALNARVNDGTGSLRGLAALLAVGFAPRPARPRLLRRWMKARRRKSLLGPGAASADRARALAVRGLTPAALARALHRDRDRPAQLLRRARDRPVGGVGRDEPRPRADHRLRPAQRDRGLRHRRAARPATREPPSWRFLGPARADRRRPDLPRHARGPTWTSRRSPSPSWRSPPARSSTSSIELLNDLPAGSPQDARRVGDLLGVVLGFATDFVLVAAGA